jgi:hypothetical protein
MSCGICQIFACDVGEIDILSFILRNDQILRVFGPGIDDFHLEGSMFRIHEVVSTGSSGMNQLIFD